MTTISLEDLYETIRGAGLNIITYDVAADSDATYLETRRAIVNSFGADALPTIIARHRTGRELRSSSQSMDTYRERRAWFNESINSKLDEIDGSAIIPEVETIVAPITTHTSPSVISGDISFPQHIHSELILRCESHFNNKDYETCVFKAFRYIEVKIRSVANLEATDIGVNLISKAMGTKNGNPIIKISEVEAEQEGYQALFRGAIASFKNPLSHKEVEYNNSARAAELLSFASSLLHIIDSRLIN